MNYLDIILAILLIVSFVFGMKKGFILSFMQLFGVLMIFVLIRQMGGVLTSEILSRLGVGHTIAMILAYILILVIVMVLVRILAYVIKKFMQLVMLGWMDGLLGGLFGLLFGFLVISIVVLIFEVTSFGTALGQARYGSRIYSSARMMSNSLRINVIDKMPGGNSALKSETPKSVS